MILFTASWCGTCVPVKQYLAEQYAGVLAVTVVDIDDDPDGLVAKHRIKSIPTLVDGDARIYGAPTIVEHLELVNRDV